MDNETKDQKKKGRPRKVPGEQRKSVNVNTVSQIKENIPLRRSIRCQYCKKDYDRNQLNEHSSAKCVENKENQLDEGKIYMELTK